MRFLTYGREKVKLKVGSKHKYDVWKDQAVETIWSQYGEDRIELLKVQKLIDLPFDENFKEIDVSPETKVEDVIILLTGQKPVTMKKLSGKRKRDMSSSDEGDAVRITERCLYCLPAHHEELDPSKRLSDYDIRDGDLLLLGEYTKVEPDPASYRAALIRDVEDFCRIVRTLEDIQFGVQDEEAPKLLFRPRPIPKGATESLIASIVVGSMFRGPGLRPVESVLLYTDEDTDIAEYIRFNFAALDEVTSYHLNVYVIEQPTQVKGILARDYWKAQLEEKKYSFLQFMGWTHYKPYDKTNAYQIAQMLNIYPDALPCVVLFGNIKSDEKIVISILDDEHKFFRKLSSIVLKTMEEMEKKKIKWDDNFFGRFKELFMEKWKLSQETENTNKETKTFIFNGQTVFINKPSGSVEIKDFQKRGDK